MERRKYPTRADDYELLEEIGHGVTAKVHRARCLPLDEIVAVKVLDLEKHTADLNNISREAQTMILINHPNLLKAHCSFANDKTLWVVMPYMAGGSCLHILKAAYTDGLEEVVIATLLREVLKGLEYLHKHGHIHRDVKAGNILVDAKSGVKLGDFGVSASLFDSGDRQRVRNTFVGTPCWMAPEVMEQLHGYDFKADIWSFGITALELAHGHAPFSKFPPMKVLLMTLQNAPPSLNYERDKKFSKAFKQMVAMCLVKDPSKRPAAHKLLKHNFFKQARSNDYIARTILEGLPPLADRIKALKEKEENLMAQKKMPDGEKEEISQSEYKRGISCWNFDIEDLKIQSALVQDEEGASEKDNSGLLNYGFDAVSVTMKRSPSVSTASCSSKDENERENIDTVLAKSATIANPDPVSTPRLKSEEVDNDSSAADKATTSNQNILQNGSHSLVNEMHNKSTGGTKSLNDKRHLEPTGSRSFHERKVSTCSGSSDSTQPLLKEESCSSHDQNQNMENCDGTIPPTANEDNDTKAKVPLVQQKGRFKVTSENIELEKAPPSPAMPKSQSLQALSQLPTSATNLPSPSPLGAKSNSVSSTVLYQQLHYFLQDNFQKRDYILNAMKQVVSGDPLVNQTTNGEISQPPTNLIERWSTLEVAQEREKELIQELTDLQWRFLSTQEELQKLKTGKPRV